MFKLVVFCALASVTAAQYYKDSKEAAIITDNRYLQGNGRHGSQYDQEDGTNFKEETDQSGNRVGSYSYLDPSGQKHTVSYTAGKDGFRATGDGVPQAPPPVAPLPQYNPPAQNWNQQQYNAPAQNWNNQQYSAPAVTERNWDESPNNKWDQWDDPGTWNSGSDATPAPAPAQRTQWSGQQQLQWTSPAQSQQRWNDAPQQPQQQPQQRQQWAQEQLTPEQQAWAAKNDAQVAQWANQQAQQAAQQDLIVKQQQLAAQAPVPAWEQPAQQPAQQPQYAQYDPTTTPAPHRFYPPGRLNLNRSPDGFSYSFNKA